MTCGAPTEWLDTLSSMCQIICCLTLVGLFETYICGVLVLYDSCTIDPLFVWLDFSGRLLRVFVAWLNFTWFCVGSLVARCWFARPAATNNSKLILMSRTIGMILRETLQPEESGDSCANIWTTVLDRPFFLNRHASFQSSFNTVKISGVLGAIGIITIEGQADRHPKISCITGDWLANSQVSPLEGRSQTSDIFPLKEIGYKNRWRQVLPPGCSWWPWQIAVGVQWLKLQVLDWVSWVQIRNLSNRNAGLFWQLYFWWELVIKIRLLADMFWRLLAAY